MISPQVSARDRGVLLQALLTINIGVNCFSLVRVRPWVYRPALMQFWANDGRPYPGGLSVPRWDRSSSSSAIDSPEACARRQIDATAIISSISVIVCIDSSIIIVIMFSSSSSSSGGGGSSSSSISINIILMCFIRPQGELSRGTSWKVGRTSAAPSATRS